MPAASAAGASMVATGASSFGIISGVSLGFQLLGGALEFFGNRKARKAQAEALRKQAMLREAEAEEIMRRAAINIEAVRKDTTRLIGEQRSVYAAAGLKLEGSPLDVATSTLNQAEEEIELMRQEAEFDATAVRLGASADRSLARSTERAGVYQDIGTIATIGARTTRFLEGRIG